MAGKHKPVRSAISIAKLLDCEGFSDYTANQLEKYWRSASKLTVRQVQQLERLEQAISGWCRDMPADKRLLLGKFVGLHKKMAFEVGLRMGLTCMAVRCDQDFDPAAEEDRVVEPLKSKTMTLNELQLRVLDVLRKVRFQFRRQAHEEGMSDGEFIEQVIEPLETTIYQDRQVLKMARKAKPAAEGGTQR